MTYLQETEIIATGDNALVPVVVVAGEDIDGGKYNASDDGWVCVSFVIDEQREYVSQPRTITDMVDVEGVMHFLAKLTGEESKTMVGLYPTNIPTTYTWCVAIDNELLDYHYTVERQIQARKIPQ